jgi:hypothetical protein
VAGLACLIAGLFAVFIVVDPLCWASGVVNDACTFSVDHLWYHYAGKGAALQFAGTCIVYSLLLMMLGLSGIYETARQKFGEVIVRAASLATFAGYVILIAGLYTDFANQNGNVSLLLQIIFSLTFLAHGWLLSLWGLIRALRWFFGILMFIWAHSVHAYWSCLVKNIRSLFR